MKSNMGIGFFCTLVIISLASCPQGVEQKQAKSSLQIVATLFPLYDFAKNIGGDKVEVTLLLPPGVEPHGFEPRPQELKRIYEADIFLFTHPTMEPWAVGLARGVEGKDLLMIDTSEGLDLRVVKDGAFGHNHHSREGHSAKEAKESGVDPHFWLDLANAQRMVDRISAAMITRDPGNAAYYRANAEDYKQKLARLDEKFSTTLATCRSRVMISGGHAAFGYLARRYGLTYYSAYPLSPHSEPTPRDLVRLIKLMKRHGTRYVFHEELLQPRVARLLAAETGAELLLLHGTHNISKENWEKGTSFLVLMEENLKNLQVGLRCP